MAGANFAVPGLLINREACATLGSNSVSPSMKRSHFDFPLVQGLPPLSSVLVRCFRSCRSNASSARCSFSRACWSSAEHFRVLSFCLATPNLICASRTLQAVTMTALVRLVHSSRRWSEVSRVGFIPAFDEEPIVLVLVGEGRCIVRAEPLAGFGAGLTLDIRALKVQPGLIVLLL